MTAAQRTLLQTYADPDRQGGTLPAGVALEIRQARLRGGQRARGQAIWALSRVIKALCAKGYLELHARDRPTVIKSQNGTEYPMFEEACITDAGREALR